MVTVPISATAPLSPSIFPCSNPSGWPPVPVAAVSGTDSTRGPIGSSSSGYGTPPVSGGHVPVTHS